MGRATDLAATLEGADSLAIVAHDDPDPDCLASALALEAIAGHLGIEDVCITYGGRISHHQNRAFVEKLAIDAVPIESVTVEAADLVAFVDHSRPGRSAAIPATVAPDIVVDHHPGRTFEADHVDVRSGFGATATIFVEYLEDLGVELTPRLGTALLFAIHRERLDFVRHPTRREYEAALAVYDVADLSLLAELYGSAFAPETVDAIGRAITTRERRDGTIVACAGRTPAPDAMPQAADYLLNVDGVSTTLVYGLVDETVRMSARTNDDSLNVGACLQQAFGGYGSFGGHHDMAAGLIDLGLFSGTVDDDQLLSLLDAKVPARFFETVGLPETSRQRQQAR